MWWYVDARDMRDRDLHVIQVWRQCGGMFIPGI